MHNIRLADPDHEITRAIKAITDKRTRMTDEDRAAKLKLEFLGGLYDEGGIHYPSANVRRCFVEAAKIRRQGTTVERALQIVNVRSELLYTGPRTLAELYADPQFQYLTLVNVNGSRVQRMRPIFPEWQVVSTWELFTDVMSREQMDLVIITAGTAQGLGDNRRNGYGRFTTEVIEL